MNKKTYTFLFILVSLFSLSMISCSDDDDNGDDAAITEWKALNETRFNDSIAKYYTNNTSSEWNKLNSESNEGAVYWKKSSIITDSDNSLRITVNGTPEFTDTVQVRFEVWYFDTDNEKIVVASTENPSYYSLQANPNKVPYTVCMSRQVSSTTQSTEYYSFGSTSTYSSIDLRTDGWVTLLQDMRVGEEREAFIPFALGYKNSARAYIPAYTMLWYRIKLLKIIPMSAYS